MLFEAVKLFNTELLALTYAAAIERLRALPEIAAGEASPGMGLISPPSSNLE
jgi:hypothetical protein